MSDGPWWLGPNSNHNKSLNSTQLLEATAACTAITYVNGKLVGDPLDVSMFESSGWVLDEAVVGELDQVVIAYVYPPEQAELLTGGGEICSQDFSSIEDSSSDEERGNEKDLSDTK